MSTRTVLGIDAAWTEREPSGVALISDDGSGWRLVEVAASYDGFFLASDGEPIVRHRGSLLDAKKIVTAVEGKTGSMPDLVAIDMPLSRVPIVARRFSDNLISSLYGARGGGTHTPSSTRPGRISDDLRAGFDEAGYRLALTELRGRDLIEVYPHPALIELAAADQRLPYKHSKIAKYWRQDLPAMRRQRLLEVWSGIITLLDGRIQGAKVALPLPAVDARGYEMKAFEDSLDAVICAWVGVCALDGRAKAYGDGESAIWVPTAIDQC
ncbi:DUF429 domain-containing protein [Sinorhizobium meliloti]|uniref:DUF429 domain-containing protein n=1 Tax=Rhizobium meliloti TaxID=382 RepID=UPI00191488BF|nr:DUF429 domain-containing protein [Sinorhizobium meliloti]